MHHALYWQQYSSTRATHQTLLFKIVVLWDALHVPLIHRSRFYLAFRGRELFYFEAEHRRLSHLQGQLLPEEESPGTGKQARRKLESAQRRLEVCLWCAAERADITAQWERKWLMHQLKYEFSEEDREELFLTWNIHRESKERKGQLLRKVLGAAMRASFTTRVGVAQHAHAGS